MARFALESMDVRHDSSGDRVEEWCRFFAETFLGDHVVPVADTGTFRGAITRRWIYDTLLVRFTASPYHVRYRAGSDAGYYVGFLASCPPGGESVRWRHSATTQCVVEVGAWDNGAVEEHVVHIVKEQTLVFVPKAVFASTGYRSGWLVERAVCPREHPAARVLADLLASVLDQSDPMPAADAVAICHAALGLLSGTLRTDESESSRAVSGEMRRRVEGWVAAQLSDGPVSPAEAVAAHGISVRSLYRLFESDTSFSEMVRALRLPRACDDLVLTPYTVQHDAGRWGYSNVSHFCREFKRTHGTTPSAFRAMSLCPS
jgi:AraC family transcriptional activator of tynA and feaB